MAVMTVLALRAIPPSPQSGVFLRRDGLGAPIQRRLTPIQRRLLRAGNSSVSARTLPECREKQCFFHASERDRRGPVGDVRLARAKEEADVAAGW